MAFRFKLKEPLDEGFCRIAAEQIERAREAAAAPAEPDVGVHDARKALKRVRALLKLVRPGIGQAAYRRENVRIRDIARLFSSRRDGAVIRQTLMSLEALNGAASASAAIAKARAALASTADGAPHQFSLAGALEALDEARISLSELALQPVAFDPLAEGLQRSYRDCRRAFHAAFADGASDEALHEWRKTVQVHWRQTVLLHAAWPEFMSARAQTARALSQILGQDHDLTLLTDVLGRETAFRIDKKSKRDLVAICRKRQTLLRRQAHVLGVCLTADGASGLSRRVALYWSTAADARKRESTTTGKPRTPVRPS